MPSVGGEKREGGGKGRDEKGISRKPDESSRGKVIRVMPKQRNSAYIGTSHIRTSPPAVSVLDPNAKTVRHCIVFSFIVHKEF